jgi:Peptidase family S41
MPFRFVFPFFDSPPLGRRRRDRRITLRSFLFLSSKIRPGSNKMVLVYTTNDIPERAPGPEPPLPAAYRDDMQRLKCTLERVEMLPHNVGYLKLNAFPDTSVCRAKAAAAMAKLNNADALIFDLRDNRGGFPSMGSLLAAYLFDHPEYMYCPLENTTAESWTRSPESQARCHHRECRACRSVSFAPSNARPSLSPTGQTGSCGPRGFWSGRQEPNCCI